jgi:phosphotransferase system  glucose/maltose/N-acetylglucosamine-specific IIC component
MIKKELLIGITVGLIANIIGIIIASILLGGTIDFIESIKVANARGNLTKLVSLGAAVNLIAFFIFIRKRQDNKAKGVLLVTIIVALFTLLLKVI